jgi:hypothetical protein
MVQGGSGSLKLPVLNRESDERSAYVRRDWAMERLRDHLHTERVRHVTHDEIPGATRKNLEGCSWVTG